MTARDIIKRGLGTTEYRLQIAGVPFEFVTHADMAKAITGGLRIHGLQRESLVSDVRVDVANATVNGGAMNFRIVDIGGNGKLNQVTYYLLTQPSVETRIIQNVSKTDSIIYVGDTSGFATGSTYHIGQEAIYLAGYTPTTLIVSRGMFGSVAMDYRVFGTFGENVAHRVTDRPAMLKNRRCKLYMYGSGDDLSGDGTLVWRGILDSDLILEDLGVWVLQAYSVAERLKQEIGAGFGDDIKTRGIYLPSAFKFKVSISQHAGTNLTDAIEASEDIDIEGFFATKEDFLTELNNKVVFMRSSGTIDQVCRFVFHPGGGLAFDWDCDAITPKVMTLQTKSAPREPGDSRMFIRGGYENVAIGLGGGGSAGRDDFYSAFMPELTFVPQATGNGGFYEVNPTSGEASLDTDTSVDASTRYRHYPWGRDWDMRVTPFPEKLAPLYWNTATNYDVVLESFGSYPHNRIYLDVPYLPEYMNKLVMEFEENIVTFTNVTVDSSNRLADVEHYGQVNIIIRNDDVKFKTTADFISDGSVYDFLSGVVSKSPLYAAEGTFPNLSDEDVDLEGIRKVLSGSGIPSIAFRRDYSFVGDPKPLSEIMSEELKAINCYPIIVPLDGRISIAPLRTPSRNELGGISITGSNFITKGALPQYAISPEGIYNTVIYKTGYNPKTDEFEGPTFGAEWSESINEAGGIKTMKIEPFSRDTAPIDSSEMDALLWRRLGNFGRKRPDLSNVQTPITAITASVGSVAVVSHPSLPDLSTGQRGLDRYPGYIRQMRIDFNRGLANMSIVLADRKYSGYTPSIVPDGVEDGDSTFTTFQINPDVYAPNPYQEWQYFSVGDAVIVRERDSWDPLEVSGTVTDVQDGAITIAYSPSISAAAENMMTSSIVVFAQYSDARTTQTQKEWCFVGTGTVGGEYVKNLMLNYFAA
jgi:hypothetical protein